MLRRSIRASSSAAARYFSAAADAAEELSLSKDGEVKGGGKGGDTLCRRLMSLVHAKRSAAVTVRKWKEEGHSLRRFDLSRSVRELRKLKRYKHALEICEWMQQQDDIQLAPGDYALQVDLIAKLHGLARAQKFFDELPANLKGQHTYSALLHTYVQHKETAKAEALMKKMSEYGYLKYALPYNHMLSLYISDGQLDKVPEVLQELKKNTSPDLVTYNLWLSVCASQNDIETAEQVFMELRKSRLVADWVTHSTMANLYIKMAVIGKAKATLREMEKWSCKKNRAAYSSLLSLYTHIGDKDNVIRIWKKFKDSFRKLNDAEYICMVSSLVKLDDIKKAEIVFAEWESVTGTRDTRVPNVLLAAYINKNQMETAEDFYINSMVQKGIPPSYTTWELLTWGYLKQKDVEKAVTNFKKAIGSVKKWEPDEGLIKEVFKLVESQGDVEVAENLLLALRQAGHMTTEIYNFLLRTYLSSGKMPLVVAERMEKDKVKPDKETHSLIKETSKLCISDTSSRFLDKA
uniref:Pentatricopeptide repeat-containing protein n=1 Tax=Kalanchoe fedtschenkoi TaxID=63787 RepID=A0A7N0SYC3_KALFE